VEDQASRKESDGLHSGDEQSETVKITEQWPVDYSVLRDLVGANATTQMLDFLPDFFEASTPQVERLSQAASRMDGREMSLVAHSLRGSSANMAMTSLVKLCLVIENHCEAGRLEEAAKQAKLVETEYARIQQAYQ
jgi:HPt (histidine-containing phosphotransfer) domain-containing protein